VVGPNGFPRHFAELVAQLDKLLTALLSRPEDNESKHAVTRNTTDRQRITRTTPTDVGDAFFAEPVRQAKIRGGSVGLTSPTNATSLTPAKCLGTAVKSRTGAGVSNHHTHNNNSHVT
jgi:hypothetical protein